MDPSCEDEYMACSGCGERMRSPCVPSLSPGSIIGDYVIQKRIGVGGMGEVYLAEQRSMMRPVALKVLNAELYKDKSYLERFHREVRTLAQIEHPNVVRAIETGSENGICYFSMMYIAGKDLKERLDTTGKIPELDALHVLLNIADALRYVWEKHKIIHRDIKPANIILTDDGEVKLMDLGISKVVENEDRSPGLTMAGMMVGSPYYVSPEQAKALDDIDFRADMYSLGASIFHLVTGKVPFDDESSMAIIAAHLSTPPPDPRSINPDVSSRTVKIIDKMMRKQKEDRYRSWDLVIRDTENAIASLSSQGKTTTMLAIPKGSTNQLAQKRKYSYSRKPGEKTNRNANGESQKRTSSKTTRNPKNSTSAFDSLQQFLMVKCFGNLYLRFVFLVILLFFTLLAFTNMVRRGIREARQKAIAAKYADTMAKIKKVKEAGNYTQRQIRDLRSTLIDIGKAPDSKYAPLVDRKLRELKKILLEINREKKERILKKTLNALEKQSQELEERGDLKEAINIWKEYDANGPFALDLSDKIKEHLRQLEIKLSKKTVEKQGIK